MIIPADVREKARAAYWNAVCGYDKVPPIEDTPCTTDAINASNQLIWNAAAEATVLECCKVVCEKCGDAETFEPTALIGGEYVHKGRVSDFLHKCKAAAIRRAYDGGCKHNWAEVDYGIMKCLKCKGEAYVRRQQNSGESK